MAASQPSTCHLLRIPRELRDEIYTHYFVIDDGYHHHAETNTLRSPDSTPIDLALLQTCKQVAAEATELTLGKNAITFKTRIAFIAGVQGELGSLLRSTMFYFDCLESSLDEAKLNAVGTLFAAYGTEELTKHISERYPQSGLGAHLQLILQLKRAWREFSRNIAVVNLPELTHMDRQAIHETLQYIDSGFPIPKWLRSWRFWSWPRHFWNWIYRMLSDGTSDRRRARRNPIEILSSTISSTMLMPWSTPTTAQINEMRELVTFLRDTDYGWGSVEDRSDLRYYESGISQCIRFLGMMQKKQLSQLRHLDIREDRASSAFPHSHAHGLIPYLKDLPRLHVAHRVDMWSAIFLHYSMMLAWANSPQVPALTGRPTCSLSLAIHKTIHWINEAMDLRHAGMPLSAYSLHLEADVKTAKRIWTAVKSLAALGLANLKRLTTTAFPSTSSTESTPQNYELDFGGRQERRLVSSVRLILSGDPTVRLSCPLGTLEEFEEGARRIGNELKDKPMDDWTRYPSSLYQGDLGSSEYDLTALKELYYDPVWEE